MNILVTGGAGYIGSHTLVELYANGHTAVVVDNLSNSSEIAIRRVEHIVGKSIPFYAVDIRSKEQLLHVLDTHHCDACIHFAGLKAVGESTAQPWRYYDNNISGTLSLLDALNQVGCRRLIFSSSATVYGSPAQIPITEQCPKGVCTNPYGWTKSMLEQILVDIQSADPRWDIVILRYFNPIGAHSSGLIGENPNGIPNNLMPYITQVAVGRRPQLGIFGDDYNTHHGTGVRDYIHVVDLARGHVAALQALVSQCNLAIYNLGTGHGYSVLDVVRTFEQVTGVHIPYTIMPRRPGDIDACYSDPSKALQELHWQAQYDLADMCRDSWRWQSQNPEGYKE